MNYQFYYQTWGNPTHPCILFLHGFMGNFQEFADVISFLNTDFFCLALDLPGHGQTKVHGRDELYQMPNVAAGIIQLLDNLSIKQCALVGYSMGGRLGFYLSLFYPQRFTQVILESASPGLVTTSQREARIKKDAGIARKLMRIQEESEFKQFLISWYKQPIFASIQQQMGFTNMLNQRLASQPNELAKSLKYMGTGVQPSLWTLLANNQLPVLLIVGAKDEKFVSINQEISRQGSNFSVQIVPKCGHNIHFQEPQLFADITRLFCCKA